ncbi:caspase-3-like [Pecten maximus]|uniref:caspase-3-like n=1 Tax=Pecten maximus TaxID=6579 RepID=UPI00145915C9|nr:caspase-3-like [Pecten maximus]
MSMQEASDTVPYGPNEGPPMPQPGQDHRNQNDGQEDPVLQSHDLYATEYKTCSEPGVAVVINNKTFEEPDLDERVGTDRDASNLYNRFNDFGYDTKHLIDKSKHDLLEELKNIAGMDHTEHSAFLCAVLTHGNKDGLWAKDSLIKISELTKIFDAENCPSLVNKPKVFIIQACRGNEEGKPIVIKVQNTEDPVVDDALPMEQDENMEVQEDARDPVSVDILTIPAIMDFLIIHATVEGEKAWRNTATGTPFIRNFCDELETLLGNRGEDDIYTLLNRVNLAVALKFQAQSGGKQMPCFVSTLTKTFKLKAPQ